MSILEMQNRYTDFALGLLLFLIFKPTNSRRGCGNVEIPALFRDFQKRLENRETCIWFSDSSTDCHFHSCAVSSLRSLFREAGAAAFCCSRFELCDAPSVSSSIRK